MGEIDIQELKVFSLEGRIGRLRYLAYGIGVGLLCLVPGTLGAILLATHHLIAGSVLLLLIYLFMVIMNVVFAIRRLHDMNASGWWALILLAQFILSLVLRPVGILIGLVFFLVLLIVPGTADENRYGPMPPANTGWVTAGAVTFFAIIPLIGMLAAIAIPAYQDYLGRAQMAEGVSLAEGAQVSVTAYFQQNKHWPSDLGSVYAPASQQTSVGRFVNTLQAVASTDGGYGIIATMKLSGVARSISGAAVEVWTRDGGNTWSCGPASSNPVSIKYLPTFCRDTESARP